VIWARTELETGAYVGARAVSGGDATHVASEYLNQVVLAPDVSSNAGIPGGRSRRTVVLVAVAICVLAMAAGLAATQSDDRFEPNDDYNESATPERGTYEDLSLDGEDDFYQLQLEESQEVDVTLAFSHAQGDVDLEIHGPDRTTLNDSMSTTDDERIQFTAPSTGTYYVRVWPFWGDSTTYDLELESDQAIQPGSDSGGLLGGDNLPLLLGAGALAVGGYVVFVRE